MFFIIDSYTRFISSVKLYVHIILLHTIIELAESNVDLLCLWFYCLIYFDLCDEYYEYSFFNYYDRFGRFIFQKGLGFFYIRKYLTPALSIYYGLTSAMVSEFIRFMGFLIIPFYFFVIITNFNDFFFFNFIFSILFFLTNLNHILASIFHLTKQIYFFSYF